MTIMFTSIQAIMKEEISGEYIEQDTKVKAETTSLMWLHTDNKMRKLVILIFLYLP